ncbi:tetratricopeptide repeat protein [uncultured Enterovirga sp.]|uniref:tetratricopeptide repeat protein n=1 Tax=uncultured Enterovirga sp. TaxID=2026352 RepID=UPI0035C9F77D
MRISSGIGLAAAFFVVASATAAPAGAADILGPLAPGLLVAESFSSVKEALRTGVRDYNAGDKIGAAKALEFAANQGHTLALWKLGRMNADGDGIPRNDVKAFEYFSRIADENADEAPESPRAGVVANAFVSLGGYHLKGIRGSPVESNPERAAEMFSYAASYFGDPIAQYNLGRLYLEGQGVELDQRQAARWLNLAAEKGHGPAQALLGQVLINGQGVPRQRARGLMWLTIAKQNADPKREAWILALHAEAFESASDTERRTATSFLEQFQAKRR